MTPADSPAAQPGLLAQRTVGPRQLRAELEDLVAKELLGPRGGPDEEVTESRLQDRYLVGMLAPKNKLIRAAEMDVLADDGDGSVEEGATDDSALPVDSLYPSSIGLTCTIHSEARQILVTARWGRYAREKPNSDHAARQSHHGMEAPSDGQRGQGHCARGGRHRPDLHRSEPAGSVPAGLGAQARRRLDREPFPRQWSTGVRTAQGRGLDVPAGDRGSFA